MLRCVFFYVVVTFLLIETVCSASILDFLYWNTDPSDIKKRDDSSAAENKSCECLHSVCMCCVDFNLTYIDLGGPGCVQMKYISQEEGLYVNVSYGENLLHSEQVKGPNPEPTCMSLLANLAEVCARFSNLLPHNDGLRGCLLLEPKLLGDVTASFNIGCFTMGPLGMKLEETNTTTQATVAEADAEQAAATATTEATTTNANSTETDSSELNEEELIATVNETAEQGLAFFTNLLGLTFGKTEANSTNTDKEISTQSQTSEIETSTTTLINTNSQQSRKKKNLIHIPNSII